MYRFIKFIIKENPFLHETLNQLLLLLAIVWFYWNVNWISSKIGLSTILKIIFQNSTLKAYPYYYKDINKASIDFSYILFLLSPANSDNTPSNGIHIFSSWTTVDAFLTVVSYSSNSFQFNLGVIYAYFDK